MVDNTGIVGDVVADYISRQIELETQRNGLICGTCLTPVSCGLTVRPLCHLERDALVAERDRWRAVACNVKDGREAAEAEVKRIKDAAQWLIDNRGHRGEEQAWRLLEKALTDE